MKTTTNNANEKKFNGKTFAEILAEVLNDSAEKMAKKNAMLRAIDETMEQISEDLKQHGDMIMGSTEITECSCDKGCGSVKIEVEFTAYKFLPHGMKVTEGKVEAIIQAK